MGFLFDLVKYLFVGFFGFIGLLVVLALLFGKRKVTKWEYEADFRDANGREFGEFDIEMSRIEKEEPDFSFRAKFKMRHEALKLHQTVQVFLEDSLVLEGMVKEAGRILLRQDEHLRTEITDAQVGQICRIVCGGQELFRQPILED